MTLTIPLSVNPLYYVTFTTCTLVASVVLFRGFNTTNAVNTISLLCGFLTIFTGVYLLNLSREDPEGVKLGIRSEADTRGKYHEVDGIPVDGLGALGTRRSMQARRSGEQDRRHRRSNSWSLRSPITGGFAGDRERDQQHVMHSYDLEANNLAELAEDSDEDNSSGRKRTSFEEANGHPRVVQGSSEGGRSRTAERQSHRMGGKSFDRVRR